MRPIKLKFNKLHITMHRFCVKSKGCIRQLHSIWIHFQYSHRPIRQSTLALLWRPAHCQPQRIVINLINVCIWNYTDKYDCSTEFTWESWVCFILNSMFIQIQPHNTYYQAVPMSLKQWCRKPLWNHIWAASHLTAHWNLMQSPPISTNWNSSMEW